MVHTKTWLFANFFPVFEPLVSLAVSYLGPIPNH
jgi:hypothetical protein